MGTVTGAVTIGPDGTSQSVEDLAAALTGCEGLVELHYAYGPDLIPPPQPATDGMWRWRDLLPLDAGPIRFPLPVGGTPLLASPGLRALMDMPHLVLKAETRSFTGSNKDRATALILEDALRRGAETVTAASTGNVAVSLAVGAAAAGVRAVIFVPATVREGKLRLMLLAGATVFKVEGGYREAFRLSRAAADTFGWCDRNTGTNPMTLEAKKTVAFEIWEQLGRQMPDVVVVPAGDGTTLSGMAKGFRELIACGVANRMPRLVGVQSVHCQPLKLAWARAADQEESGESTDLESAIHETIADGIAVDVPANAATAVRDVRESLGGFVAVSDEAILRSIQALARSGGVLAEPAAAAGFAGLQPALESGLIDRSERVAVLLTGSGLKTPQDLVPCEQVFTIGAGLDDPASSVRAVAQALDRVSRT